MQNKPIIKAGQIFVCPKCKTELGYFKIDQYPLERPRAQDVVGLNGYEAIPHAEALCHKCNSALNAYGTDDNYHCVRWSGGWMWFKK